MVILLQNEPVCTTVTSMVTCLSVVRCHKSDRYRRNDLNVFHIKKTYGKQYKYFHRQCQKFFIEILDVHFDITKKPVIYQDFFDRYVS